MTNDLDHSGSLEVAVESEPRRRSVAGAGVRLALLDYGNEGAPPAVLLHGIRDLAWSLDPLARALQPRFRVLSPDLRGHGASEHSDAYTFPHYVADLHQVVQSLELEAPFLIGHSLGGQIVCQYAALFPEVPAGVVTIEGLGPPLRPGEATTDGRRRLARQGVEALAELRTESRRMASLEEALERVLDRHPGLERERARLLVEEGTRDHPEGGLRWRWDPRVQGTWTSTTRELTEERWSWVRCPVLVVTAGRAAEFWRRRRGMDVPSQGRLDPAELRRRLACFRDVRHVEIAEAGHMVHFDAPERLAAVVLDFLSQGSSRDAE